MLGFTYLADWFGYQNFFGRGIRSRTNYVDHLNYIQKYW